MESSKWEARYHLFSFILSLYLLFSIATDYMDVSERFREINTTITIGILLFFVLEIIILFAIAKDKRKFLKENWISVAAIAISIPAVAILNVFEELGIFFAIYLVKMVKTVKFFKLFKLTKIVKVQKSVKLGKKTVKSVKKIRLDQSEEQ